MSGEIFKYNSITNLLLSLAVKFFFENRQTFGEVTDMNKVPCFFTLGVQIYHAIRW